jgi:MTH538 TIR-like domain (DUF1863)
MGFFSWLFGSSEDSEREEIYQNRKPVFISFAIEDEIYRDYLIEQARKEHSPFDMIDMSVKQPWSQEVWRKKCRTKIRRCRYVIVLLSKNTYNSSGVKWEVKCALEAKIPIRGMYIKKYEKVTLPYELRGIRTMDWTWDNLRNFLK